MRKSLEDAGIALTSAEVTMIPKNTVALDEADARKTYCDFLMRWRRTTTFRRSMRTSTSPTTSWKLWPGSGLDGLMAEVADRVISRSRPGDGFHRLRSDIGCGQPVTRYRVWSDRYAAGAPLEQRLERIHAAVTELLEKYRPGATAVESLYFNLNVRTALAVGHARGGGFAGLFAGGLRGVRVHSRNR